MASKRIFNHVLKRNYSQAIDYTFIPGEKSTKGVEKAAKLWRNISLFVGIPSLIVTGVNAYLIETEFEETFERPEYVEYEYLSIITKPWPWGNGKRSLFFNPERNAIRGIGYEQPWGHSHSK